MSTNAKRGDMIIIRHVSFEATYDGRGRDRVSYEAGIVTSITRDGAVKAYRDLRDRTGEAGFRPYQVKHLGRHTLAIVPAARFHVDDAIGAIMASRATDHGYLPRWDNARELYADLAPWHAADPDALAEVRRWVDAQYAAEVDAQRCEHTTPDQAGCERALCNGVPSDAVAFDRDAHTVAESEGTGYEPGTDTLARAFTFRTRTVIDPLATMPAYAATAHYDRPNVRDAQRYVWSAAGHELTVIIYAARPATARDTLPHAAILVDGVTIATGVEAWKTSDALAASIVHTIVRHLESIGWQRPTVDQASAPASVAPVATVDQVTPDAAPVALARCGCPQETIDVAGIVGHRVGCVHHVEPSDLVDQASADADATPDAAPVATVDQASELPADSLAFTADAAALADAVVFAVAGIAKRCPIPILTGVLLTATGDQVTVSTFDYEQSRTVTVPATRVTAGRAIVAGRALAEMLAKRPKGATEVTVSAAGTHATVTCGTAQRTLPTFPVEDYPSLPVAPATVGTVDVHAFAAAVARVAAAAGNDDTLPMLTGVRVGSTPATDDQPATLTLAATDRYRLTVDAVAWSPVDATGMPDSLPYAVTLASVVKSYAKVAGKSDGSITIGREHGMLSLTFGAYTMTTRVMDGQFPKVEALIPSTVAATLTVDVAALIDVAERVAKALDRGAALRLTCDADTLTVAAGSGENEARESLPCQWTGDAGVTFMFNDAYLVAGLKSYAPPKRKGAPVVLVTFGATHTVKPVTITATEDTASKYVYLIMPVRGGDDRPVKSDQATTEPKGNDTVSSDAPAKGTRKSSTRKGTRKAAEPVADAAPVVDQASAPASVTVDAEPVADAPAAPALVDVVERVAHEAFEAMHAGNYGYARERVANARDLAPAGYLVAGLHTFDALDDMIDAHARAAGRLVADTPAAPATTDAEPVADAAAPVDQASAPAADAAPVDVDTWETLAASHWSHDVLTVGPRKTRRVAGFDVLTLPEGRLSREQYTAVRDVLATLGGSWHKAARGFIFEPSRIVWNGTAQGARTASGRSLLDAWLLANDPTGRDQASAPAAVDQVDEVDAPAPDASADAEPVADAVDTPATIDAADQAPHGLTVGMHAVIVGTNGHGEPLTVTGHVAGWVGIGSRHDARGVAYRVHVSATPGGPSRTVYVTSDSAVTPVVDQASADATPVADAVDQVPAPAAEPVADAAPVAIDPHDFEALAAAYQAALAKMTGQDIAVTVAPVDQVPAPDAEPVASADAGPLAFELPKWTDGALSYRDSRTEIRRALYAAGIGATVEGIDGNRRGVLVTLSDPTRRADAARIVAERTNAAELETVG